MSSSFKKFSFGLVVLLSPVLGPTGQAAGSGDASNASENDSIPTQTWLQPISDTLSDHFHIEGDWTIDLVRDFVVPKDVVVEVIEMPAKPASQMMLRLRLHDANDRTEDSTIFVRAQLWRDAWVAREPLARGGNIDTRLLEIRRVDVLRERDLVPVDTVIDDLMITRGLPSGRFVTWRDVSRRPLVRRGQMIDVAAVDGSLAISMKALALQDGAAGELVRVRNTESNREFAALVTSNGQAEVRF